MTGSSCWPVNLKRLGTASSWAVRLPQARALYDFIVAHRRHPRKARAKSLLSVKVALSVGRQFIFLVGSVPSAKAEPAKKGQQRQQEQKPGEQFLGRLRLRQAGEQDRQRIPGFLPQEDHGLLQQIPALRHRQQRRCCEIEHPWPSSLPSRTSERRKITPQSALPSHTVLFPVALHVVSISLSFYCIILLYFRYNFCLLYKIFCFFLTFLF